MFVEYWVLNVSIAWMIEWKSCCLRSSGHLNLTLRFPLRILERHRLLSNVLYSSQIQRVRIRCHFLCAPSLTYDHTSGCQWKIRCMILVIVSFFFYNGIRNKCKWVWFFLRVCNFVVLLESPSSWILRGQFKCLHFGTIDIEMSLETRMPVLYIISGDLIEYYNLKFLMEWNLF